MMSSMRRMAFFAPIFLATGGQCRGPAGAPTPMRRSACPCPAPLQAARQRQLRASPTGAACARARAIPSPTYARFLAANPDWPGESAMRRAAEKAMRSGESPLAVAAILPHRRADQRQWLGAARRGASRHGQARRGASPRRRARGRRPTSPSPTKACSSRASGRSSAPPTTTAASTPCCSPRSRPRPSGCCPGRAPRAAPPSTRASRC